MNRGRVMGAARRYGWYAPLVAMVVAGVLVAVGAPPQALGGHGGSRPAPAVLAPGSSGSITHYPWWDPRGWLGGGGAAKPRTIAAGGGPQRGRLPRQVAVPAPRRVRELTSRRTADARVYQLSDGRLQAAVSAVPVNYRDSGGRWQPIDTTVSSTARPGFSYGSTSNTFGSFFGTSAGRLVRLEAPGGGWLEIGTGGAHPGRPVVAGNTVTYRGIAPGVALSYQVTPVALKERIILASPSAASSFSFTVKAGGGLVPYQQRDGSIALSRDGTGGPPALVIPRPFMTDARGDRRSPYGVSWSPAVSQHASWDATTSTMRITVAADPGWLRQAVRVFPVVIDPTIEIAPTPSDAQNTMIISDSGESSVNYSSSWRLSVGTDSGGAARALVKFPLTGIPSGTQIDSADLRMYYDQNFGTMTSTMTAEAHQATAAWDATTATWDNANNIVGQLGSNQVVVDDSDTAATSASGAWPTAADSSAVGGEYRYDQDTVSGDTFTWVPPLTESGSYQVEAHYVAKPNAATAAPYTVYYNGGSQTYPVNQQSGSGGVWTTLGTQPFTAGTTGKIVLGDGPASASTMVQADAVRLTKPGTVVISPSVANVWDSFPVRNIVQSWLDGTSPNYGFVVKDANETTLNQGGVRYEASRFAYQGEVATYPQLVLTYGRPSVTLNQITTIHATGADLSWTPYTDPTPGSNPGDDLAEYQVHRSVYQAFTPSASTLVSPVAAGTTAYSDTSAVPTPASSPDPFGNAFYYMVAVKTQDGQIIAGPTGLVRLPKAGYAVKVIDASGDTTLSAAQPATSQEQLAGQPWLAAGDNSTIYGVTRTVVNYPPLASQGIPASATVTEAHLKLWGWQNNNTGGGSATYEAHALTQDFDPATATWNNASASTPWTTPGGAYSATAAGTVTGLTNDPNRQNWPVTAAVQDWLANPADEHGLLVKLAGETSKDPQEQELFLNSSAAEAALRPELVVTYLDTTPQDTYYVPGLPGRLASAASYTVPVTVTNTTGTTLAASDWTLSYHWTLPDGTDVSTTANQAQTALPADLPAGNTVTISAQLTTPDTSGTGNARTAYQLGWDLYNKTTSTWLSGTNPGVPTIAPLNQPASVEQPGSNLLGLEKFYQYTGVNTGSGSALLNNAGNGNVVWSYNPFSHPSRGFATFVRLAYNSMDTTNSSMGFGWSLQASTLMRLGTPLDFQPKPPANTTTVTLTDGDGTSHWFTWNAATSQWLSPPGVHYYLQQEAICDPSGKTENARAWLLTRPDRTQFWFDCQGYQTAVIDHNGNEADFTYTERNSNNQPVKFLDYITDPAGRQTLTLSYYAKGDTYSYIDANGNVASGTNLTNPKIIDEVKSITDISGRAITFLYTTQGLMAQMTDGSGSTVKTFKFGYDMTQGNKNVKLVSVTDPRQHATQLAYYTAPQDPKFKWSLNTITDRRLGTTSFAYTEPAGGGIQTVVTDQDTHSSTYLMDTTGRPVQVTNAKSQVTKLAWDGDNNVTSLTADNGAQTTWTYDPNTGYPLTKKDAQANHDGTAGTTYTYQTGLSGHIADLTSLLTPQQRLWTFGYDANGNITSVTKPLGNASGATAGSYTTHYTYDTSGDLLSAKDPDGNTTTYASYDPTGYPQQITDALTHATSYVYSSTGQVTSVTDPLGHTTTQAYDIFGRPGQKVVPKIQASGVYITTPAPVYDGNDNVTQSTAPNGAVTTYAYNAGDQLTSKVTPADTGTPPSPTTTYTYDADGNLATTTQPDGNVSGATPGSYTTSYGYDQINEQTSSTDAAGGVISYGYNDVGDRTSITDPKTNQTQSFYNLNHQLTQTTDPAGNTTKAGYDLDGLAISATDKNGNTTLNTLDADGQLTQQQVPAQAPGAAVSYDTTQYAYDQAGNRTKVISPRGVASGISGAYTTQTQYNADNQVSAQLSAYNPSDPVYNTPATTSYSYDNAGRLSSVSAPPSGTQPVRNLTSYAYFDNGWAKSSTDPWNITASYDYTSLGEQSTRTITSAGGDMSRTMTWGYYPDGKLASVADNGVPTGLYSEEVDNSDAGNAHWTGTWPASTSGTGYEGYNYQTHAAGTGTDTFTWHLNIPADGNYTVYVKYPAVSGAATTASFKVTYSGATATVAVNQTKNSGTWVSLGKWAFTQAGTGQQVTLAENSGGAVVADAVKAVRDKTGTTNTAHHNFGYTYDTNGNLTGISDTSPGTAIPTYVMAYDQLSRLTSVIETNSAGTSAGTTTYGYDADSNLTSRNDGGPTTATFTYNNLNQLVSDTDASNGDNNPVTTFGYTPTGQVSTEVKPNRNTVAYTYYANGQLQHQTENTSGGTLVASHADTYDPNGNKTQDIEKLMSADNNSSYLSHTLAYTYDPLNRIKTVSTDGTTTESYAHDPNGNVTSQTINGTTTSYGYDRNRLLTATSGSVTSSYNYDPSGRLDTITTGGTVLERNTYDGFDHITTHQQYNPSTHAMDTTSYTWDPLNRMESQTTTAGTTSYAYLGLTGELSGEWNLTEGKTYIYTPGGMRIEQGIATQRTNSSQFYTYNDHSDVEAVTGTGGGTIATYGYTAYGQNITSQFTGADKTNTSPSQTTQPYNSYRYNAMRWDSASGQYDMGFRNYDPGLNQFLTRDMYNGALTDMGLDTDPFTGGRYTFGDGNPITNIELDGHMFPGGSQCGILASNPCNPSPATTSTASRTSSGGSTSSGCGVFMPNCTNPCVKYVGLCLPLGSQLNDGTQPGRGNSWIWPRLPGVCTAPGLGFLFSFGCGNLAATGGNSGQSGAKGSGGSGFGSNLSDFLLRLLAQALNGANTGPGEWGLARETFPSLRSIAYQEQITGQDVGLTYRVNGVKFDGIINGVLQEAKGEGYGWAVKDGEFIPNYKGAAGIIKQGASQVAAANGVPITWSVAEQPVVSGIDTLFAQNGITGINVVYAPPTG